MTFTATHARGVVGTDISLTVCASAKDSIATVAVTFDGELLEERELGSGTESYSRSFAGVGSATPGMEHVLVVTATDGDGTPHSATTAWSDS